MRSDYFACQQRNGSSNVVGMDYQTKKTHYVSLSYEEVEEAIRLWLKAQNVFPPRDIRHKKALTGRGVCYKWEAIVKERG